MSEHIFNRLKGRVRVGLRSRSRVWVAGAVLLGLIASAFVLFVVVSSLRNQPVFSAANGGSGAESDASEVTYSCPMHPSVVSKGPGACPICGMTLVSGEEKGAEGHGSHGNHEHELPVVSLNSAQRVMANVATTKAELRNFSTETISLGKVSWDERRLTRVSARIAGRVERLHVNFTGARVAAGQRLLDIYSPELVSAQKEYLLAVEGAEQAKENPAPESREMMEGLREASRSRLKLWGMTDGQIRDLTRTRRPKTVVTIFSPVSGVVTERSVTAGQYVNEGTPLFSLASLTSLWVEAELYENQLADVTTGAPAVGTSDAYPGRPFTGKVTFVDPMLNPETRTLKARIELVNPGGLLKPEMFVRAAIHGRSVRALAVPEEAVVVTGDRALVWIETASGVFEPRPVTVGRGGDGFREVLSGLRGGESVAVSGGFLIDSESRLKAAQSGAAAEHEHGGKGR